MESNGYPNLTIKKLEQIVKDVILDTPKVNDKKLKPKIYTNDKTK
jgi:hypothetical protein